MDHDLRLPCTAVATLATRKAIPYQHQCPSGREGLNYRKGCRCQVDNPIGAAYIRSTRTRLGAEHVRVWTMICDCHAQAGVVVTIRLDPEHFTAGVLREIWPARRGEMWWVEAGEIRPCALIFGTIACATRSGSGCRTERTEWTSAAEPCGNSIHKDFAVKKVCASHRLPPFTTVLTCKITRYAPCRSRRQSD